jgi:hypothetical protein
MVVGHADDRAEHDADRVAHEVVARLSSGESGESHVHDGCHGIARVAAPSTGSPEVGREGGAISDDLTSRIEARRGTGSALPTDVRRRMESGFGRSLADVRVHTDGESARLNRAVSARAFTTGKDIFFGAGEYSPGTAAGERVLAHEIAHTQQHGGGARRLHRLWDLTAPAIDWNAVTSISTLDSGQQVYFFADASGDQIVVKAEDRQVGIGQLSTVMHKKLSGVESVDHRKLTPSDKAATIGLIKDPALQDRRTFGALGSATRARYKWVIDELEQKHGYAKGTGAALISDLEIAQHLTEALFSPGQAPATMVAMSFASGQTAKTAGKSAPKAHEPREKNRMRSLMTNWKHMEALGRLHAVDLFLGNRDRVVAGNLGNWIYDPDSSAITAIDHVDGNVSTGFKNNDRTVPDLNSKQLGRSATEALDGLCSGLRIFSDDPDASAWVDSEPHRRQMMEESLERGMKVGRALLVKTFLSTRFTIGGSKDRKVKKSIKSAAKAGVRTDKDNPSVYV